MKTAIQFGAGNIGRGFIGKLLSNSGYLVVFADISKTLIPEMRIRKEYAVEIVGEELREERITPVMGMYSDDPELLEAIAHAEVITTAVGPNILGNIAPVIAKGIEARKTIGNDSSLNIIACENMIGGSTMLRREVVQYLSEDTQEWMADCTGFPDSTVDRIVPPMDETMDILRVRVEEFCEWIVDESGFIGTVPEIEGMQLSGNLGSFVERKLFTLNTGHAITAYLGALKGYKTIAESIADPQIFSVVHGAMVESGEVLIQRYNFDRSAHMAYIDKILARFRNPWLNDRVDRVGRQPIRKLGANERFIKPLRGTMEYGTPNRNLIAGIVAALRFQNDEDDQAVKLLTMLNSMDLKQALKEITSLESESIIAAIASAYGSSSDTGIPWTV